MLNCQMKYQMDPITFMWFISTYLVPENNFFGGGAIILENSIMRYELRGKARTRVVLGPCTVHTILSM